MGLPKQIAEFDIKEPLGEGGLGPVYRAFQSRLGRAVALHLIDPERIADRTYRLRLERYLARAAALRHPCAIGLLDHGTDQGVKYAAFELVDGEPIPEGLSGNEALALALVLCDVLVHAHALDLVHGSIRPDLLLLDEEGLPRLLELGLPRPDAIEEGDDLSALGACLTSLLGDDDPARARDVAIGLREGRYPSAGAAAREIGRALQGQDTGRIRLPGVLAEVLGSQRAEAAPPLAEGSPPRDVAPQEAVTRRGRDYYGSGSQLMTSGVEAHLATSLDVWGPRTLRALRGEQVEEPEEVEEEVDESLRMILSEDMSRAYKVESKLGQGGRGVVYKVRVEGNTEFPGFARPVEVAALKTSKDAESLLRERAIYSQPNPSIIKLLDHGKIQGSRSESPFLLLERLYPHPYQLFGGGAGRTRVDLATAVNTFVNLLASVHELYFRKTLPLILCDIKPDNIMLRISSPETLTVGQYLERIALNAYEPVLMDMGCAQHSGELRKVRGRVESLLATPLYMPPESFPHRLPDGEFVPGVCTDRMDVYALTLTFYMYVTGERPYPGQDLAGLPMKERIALLLRLKREPVDPVDHDALRRVVQDDLDVYEEIFRAGLHPSPDYRASAKSLLDLVRRRFRVTELHPRKGEYHYDQVAGLRLAQGVYRQPSAADNVYVNPGLHTEPLPKVAELERSRVGATGRHPRPSASGRIKRPSGRQPKRPSGRQPRASGRHPRPSGRIKRPPPPPGSP